jgi:membrane protein
MIRKFFRRIWKKYIKIPVIIFKYSAIDTIKQDGIEHAGYLAFLSILSLFPFLIFLMSMMTSFGDSEIGARMIVMLLGAAPSSISDSIAPRVEEIVNGPPQSLLTVAVVGIIWTASSAVEGVRTILNRAYRVFSPPPYILRRLLSIFQFFMITITITAAVILLVIFPAMLGKVELALSPHFRTDYDWFYLRQATIFLILLIATALLYYIIPNVDQKFIHALPGAAICVGLWAGILDLFFIYLEKFNQFNLLYGSLGGIIGVLMFFYLTSLVFFIGAEFNYNFVRMYKLRKKIGSA